MVVQINSYIMTENTLFTSMQLTTLHFNPHRSSKQLKVSLQIKHGHTRVLGPVVGFGIHREQSVSCRVVKVLLEVSSAQLTLRSW